ncbi:hypothetical protein Tco_0537087 [Tanacetum coccineum]
MTTLTLLVHLKSHSSSIKTPSCGKGAHIGYNCPSKAPIISNPEPCNQTIDELLQTLPSFDPTCYSGDENSFTYDSNLNFVDDSPNPPPQPPTYSDEFCGNNAYYGYDCPPQVLFVYNLEPCYNQDFNFPQNFQNYYHEQNSCYDPNSFGFDQFQPPQYTVNYPIFNAKNKFLNSQNKLMEQMTSICDMAGQIMQKKEEDKQIAEEHVTKDQYWKIPICYDDDEDYTIAITPVLSTEEPVDSLIIEDEHLDAISTTESDEVIKSSVENLVQIPSESEGIPDSMCDVPLCNNPTPLETFKEHSEIVVDFSDDSTSSDDDSPYGEDIDYVDASPPDVEIVSSEVVEIVVPEVRGIDTDILLTIKDDILREKLLNVNLLIAKIDALKDNPTPSSSFVTKSSSTFPNSFLKETNTFNLIHGWKPCLELPMPLAGQGKDGDILIAFCMKLRPSLDWSQRKGWTLPTVREEVKRVAAPGGDSPLNASSTTSTGIGTYEDAKFKLE